MSTTAMIRTTFRKRVYLNRCCCNYYNNNAVVVYRTASSTTSGSWLQQQHHNNNGTSYVASEGTPIQNHTKIEMSRSIQQSRTVLKLQQQQQLLSVGSWTMNINSRNRFMSTDSSSSSSTSASGDVSSADQKEEQQQQQQPDKEYTTKELTDDAARHKEGLNDPTRPFWQNPLHHNNPDYDRQFPEDYASEEEFKKNIDPAPPVQLPDGSTPVPQYIHDIAEELVHLTMLEMSELANKIADHFGFHEGMLQPDDDDDSPGGGGSAGAGVEDDDGDTGSAAAAAAATEKTKFDVKLIEYDASAKIKIIKEVRSVAGLGLKEAKDAVEGVPKTIMKDLSKEQAEELKKKFEELGAKIEIV